VYEKILMNSWVIVDVVVDCSAKFEGDVVVDCSAKFEGGCMGLAPSPLPIKGPTQQAGYLE